MTEKDQDTQADETGAPYLKLEGKAEAEFEKQGEPKEGTQAADITGGIEKVGIICVRDFAVSIPGLEQRRGATQEYTGQADC